MTLMLTYLSKHSLIVTKKSMVFNLLMLQKYLITNSTFELYFSAAMKESTGQDGLQSL
jgi:hypothetical protein